MDFDIDAYWLRIRDGDEKAFEILYKKLFSSLCLYASHISGDTYISEEIVQDVFLKIYQNRTSIIINGSFKAYIFQSVHNHALNSLRQQKTQKESVNICTSEDIWNFIADNYDVNDNIIGRMISDETENLIKQVINVLPEQCSRIFRMSRFELMTNTEIAKKLKLSEHTVKSHIYRALEKINLALTGKI
jgi:RNA polymerase sigma-70 factor (ECF subfamily)